MKVGVLVCIVRDKIGYLRDVTVCNPNSDLPTV